MPCSILSVQAPPSWALLVALVACLAIAPAAFATADRRNIRTGLEIPSENYADQPYVVITAGGNWLCTMTTGKGVEGRPGQHVVATVSRDRGRSWSPLIDIEPADGPEASWVTPLAVPPRPDGKRPGGRVYAFYTYNGERVSSLPGRAGRVRSDTHGWYCYRCSDDGGRTWSRRRHRIPLRVTACDRGNDWKGAVQMFWGIDKPKIVGGSVYFAFTKLGRHFLADSEGWVLRSANLLVEPDAARVHFELLPAGEHGIRGERFGSVQEEHNVVSLGGGRLGCAYRTTRGHPCWSASADGGRSWSAPAPMTYRRGGPVIRHPRACARVWRCGNGKFLFWYHNHGGKDFRGRNPVWLAGGVEADGAVRWSQPEIVLYDPDPQVRMSYPDLIEQDGRYWLTETQKTIARVHEVDASLLAGLWRQHEARAVARRGLVLSAGADKLGAAAGLAMPRLPDLSAGGGFAIGLWLRLRELAAGQVVLDSRDGEGRGLAVTTTAGRALRLEMSDGRRRVGWSCDPRLLAAGRDQHVVFIVDGGPKIVSVVVDGRLCDGGSARQHGWGRFAATKKGGDLRDVTGGPKLRVAPSLKGRLTSLRIYNRYLRTSEAVGNYRAGPPGARAGRAK